MMFLTKHQKSLEKYFYIFTIFDTSCVCSCEIFTNPHVYISQIGKVEFFEIPNLVYVANFKES